MVRDWQCVWREQGGNRKPNSKRLKDARKIVVGKYSFGGRRIEVSDGL